MPSYNDYKNNGNNHGGNKSGSQNANTFEMLRTIADKYEGVSESELIRIIIAEAEKNRAQGKLSDADLDNFAKTIKPMLNSSQAKRLDKIVERLKQK